MQNGKHNIKDIDYHALDRVSSTKLKKLIASSPMHLKHYLDNPVEPTPAMVQGSAVHKMVLEPDLFNDSFVLELKVDKRTTAGKAHAAEFEMNNFGKTILAQKQMDIVTGISAAISAHPMNELIFKNSEIETSFLWTDKDTGIDCKCRPDILNGSTLTDLKTTTDASARGFARQSAELNYHVQLAFYADGVEAVTGVKIYNHMILAVETGAPHAIAYYRYDDAAIHYGRSEYKRALLQWAKCKKENDYPGYSVGIQDLFLPSWKMPDIEDPVSTKNETLGW